MLTAGLRAAEVTWAESPGCLHIFSAALTGQALPGTQHLWALHHGQRAAMGLPAGVCGTNWGWSRSRGLTAVWVRLPEGGPLLSHWPDSLGAGSPYQEAEATGGVGRSVWSCWTQPYLGQVVQAFCPAQPSRAHPRSLGKQGSCTSQASRSSPSPPACPAPRLKHPRGPGLRPRVGARSGLSAPVLEEGALQEGGQLGPVVLVEEAVVDQLSSQVRGAVSWEQIIGELPVQPVFQH